MGTHGSTVGVQRRPGFLSGIFASDGIHGNPGSNSFGAIIRLPGAPRRITPHDLRRACTRTDPIPRRRPRVGRGDADLVTRRNARRGGGRRLRVRLHGAGWHGGGGGRGKRHLAAAPALCTAPAAAPRPQPSAQSHAHSGTAAPTPAGADTDADPAAEARPHPGTRAATPAAPVTPAGGPPGAAARPADTRSPTAASLAAPGAHGHARAASVRDARALPAVPAGPGPTVLRRRHVAAHLRPAHHDARGGRRRRAAPALNPTAPGGTSCRNGLFSPF